MDDILLILGVSSGMSPGTALGFFWALGGVHRKF
jgi:hypothetical protein